MVLQAKAQAELQRRSLRAAAEASLYVFCRDVLGYRDFHERLHRPLCDFVQAPQKQLLLLPRGHFKSTIISVAYPLWLLAKYPDTRILLNNATLENPRKWVGEMLQHLRGNVVVRWTFPELVPQEDVEDFGFVESFTVPSRKATWGEASVEITSVENNVVSRHYEVILFDDLVSENNAATKAGLERVEERYRKDQALLQGVMQDTPWKVPPPHVKVVGTRWHFDDLYGSLLARGFPSMVRKAVEDGEPIFPTLFTKETLAERRLEMGSSVYASQMMNDPIDSETAIFKRENATYHDTHNTKGLNVAITVDLAISERTSADESCVMVTGVDSAGKLFVLDFAHGRWLPDRTISEIYRLFDQWNARMVYFESVGFQKVFKYLLSQYAQQVQRWLPIREVRPDADKYRRIVALSPFHEAHRLLIRREMTALEDQMYRFPKTKHDDILDALAMRVMRAVWHQTDAIEEENLGEWSVARLEKELAEQDEEQHLSWWSSDTAHLWPDPKD
jgi:predicted phage terminase large subunit-like protein